MNYRLLDRDETMQKGDEVLANGDAEAWEPIPHWSIGMPHRRFANNPVRRALGAPLDRDAVIERLQSRIEHSDYFNGVRFARLWHWARDELNEVQKSRCFRIVANGTADTMESPTYAQQMNMLRHRAERAEAELVKLRATLGVGTVAPPLHPNHLADLRYVLGVLQKLLPQHKRDSLRGDIEAAINGMRYIVKRTEDATPAHGVPGTHKTGCGLFIGNRPEGVPTCTCGVKEAGHG